MLFFEIETTLNVKLKIHCILLRYNEHYEKTLCSIMESIKNRIFKQLIIFSLIASFVICAGAYFFSVESTRRFREEIEDSTVQNAINAFSLFDVAASMAERDIDRSLYSSLPELTQEIQSMGKANLTEERLVALTHKYHVDDIYMINNQGTVFVTTFAPDKNLNLFSISDSFANNLRAMFGKGNVHVDRLGFSSRTGILKIYAMYSPVDSDYLIEVAVNFLDAVRARYSVPGAGNELENVFHEIIRATPYVVDLDIFKYNQVGRWSLLNQGNPLPLHVAQQLETSSSVIVKNDDVITQYRSFTLNNARLSLSGSGTCIMVSYNFSSLESEPLYAAAKIWLIVILVTIPAFILAARFINTNVMVEVGQVNSALESMSQGRLTYRIPHARDKEFDSIFRHISLLCRSLKTKEADVVHTTNELLKTNSDLNLFREIFEHSLDGILITDLRGRIVMVNDAFVHITGYTGEEVRGHTPRILKSDRHHDSFYRQLWVELVETGEWQGEIWNRRKDGSIYAQWTSIVAIQNNVGVVTHYVGQLHDATAYKEQEAYIRFQANHDALTKLPNRALLHDRLDMGIRHAKHNNSKLALLFLDLDNFKSVNDSLGHDVGDELLIEAAKRLQSQIRDEDTLARLGGDEFVILLHEIHHSDDVVDVLRRILRVFRAPLELGGAPYYVTTSIGASVFPDDGHNVDSLIKCSDVAMYSAKQSGRNTYAFYTAEMGERSRRKLELEQDLRHAVENQLLDVLYQPIFSTRANEIIGVEARLYWNGTHGLVDSETVHRLAQKTGISQQVDALLLENAIAQVASWRHDFGQALFLSLDMSAAQAADPDLPARIGELAGRYGMPPGALSIDIQEADIVASPDHIADAIRRLTSYGVKVAIDGFGAGASLLMRFHRFDVASIKLDKSIVSMLSTQSGIEYVLQTMAVLSSTLGVNVAVNGVETREQLEVIMKSGCCRSYQGTFASTAVAAHDITKQLQDAQKCSKEQIEKIS